MKIRFRFSLVVIAIMVVTVTVISVFLLRQAMSMQTAKSQESARRLAEAQALTVKNNYETMYYVTRSLRNVMEGFEEIDPLTRRERFNFNMQQIIEREQRIVEIFTVWYPNAVDGDDAAHIGEVGSSATGRYATAFSMKNGRPVKETYSDRDMAYIDNRLASMTRENIVLGNLTTKMVDGRSLYVFSVSLPIANRAGKLVGLVGIMLDISDLQVMVENIINQDDSIAGITVYMTDGTILASLQTERIGKNIRTEESSLWGSQMEEAVAGIQEGRELVTEAYSPLLKETLFLILAPLRIGTALTPWGVMIGVSEAVIYREVREMEIFTILIALGAILISALIVYFVARGVTKPVMDVAMTLRDISEGEGDLTHQIAIHSKDEVGDLARYFNLTIGKIRTLVVTIKNQAAALFDIGNELAANMGETAAVVNQIAAHIQSIKTRALNQSAGVTEANATMEQITLNIGKLNRHVETQSDSVSQSSAAIEEMIANIQSVTATLMKNASSVQELTEASEVGRTGLQAVVTDIQDIARESEGLLEINGVMENIASQTNLLSMNAAIEAAHAGESGKGFAVVADEIRKLAVSSSEQSKTISIVLKKIKGSIDKISRSTDAVLNKFAAIDTGVRTVSMQTENIRAAMEEQNTGSREILEEIGSLNSITQQVKNSTELMMEGSSQVIQETKNLEMATQEITEGMGEMASGADQINTAVARVNEISSHNKESIDLLVKEVSKFKVE